MPLYNPLSTAFIAKKFLRWIIASKLYPLYSERWAEIEKTHGDDWYEIKKIITKILGGNFELEDFDTLSSRLEQIKIINEKLKAASSQSVAASVSNSVEYFTELIEELQNVIICSQECLAILKSCIEMDMHADAASSEADIVARVIAQHKLHYELAIILSDNLDVKDHFLEAKPKFNDKKSHSDKENLEKRLFLLTHQLGQHQEELLLQTTIYELYSIGKKFSDEQLAAVAQSDSSESSPPSFANNAKNFSLVLMRLYSAGYKFVIQFALEQTLRFLLTSGIFGKLNQDLAENILYPLLGEDCDDEVYESLYNHSTDRQMLQDVMGRIIDSAPLLKSYKPKKQRDAGYYFYIELSKLLQFIADITSITIRLSNNISYSSLLSPATADIIWEELTNLINQIEMINQQNQVQDLKNAQNLNATLITYNRVITIIFDIEISAIPEPVSSAATKKRSAVNARKILLSILFSALQLPQDNISPQLVDIQNAINCKQKVNQKIIANQLMIYSSGIQYHYRFYCPDTLLAEKLKVQLQTVAQVIIDLFNFDIEAARPALPMSTNSDFIPSALIALNLALCHLAEKLITLTMATGVDRVEDFLRSKFVKLHKKLQPLITEAQNAIMVSECLMDVEKIKQFLLNMGEKIIEQWIGIICIRLKTCDERLAVISQRNEEARNSFLNAIWDDLFVVNLLLHELEHIIAAIKIPQLHQELLTHYNELNMRYHAIRIRCAEDPETLHYEQMLDHSLPSAHLLAKSMHRSALKPPLVKSKYPAAQGVGMGGPNPRQ